MKLEPRVRRAAPNYLVDNADALKLGSVYFGSRYRLPGGTPKGRKRGPKSKPAAKTAKRAAAKPTHTASKEKRAAKKHATKERAAAEKAKAAAKRTKAAVRKAKTAAKKGEAAAKKGRMNVTVAQARTMLLAAYATPTRADPKPNAVPDTDGRVLVAPVVRLLDNNTVVVPIHTDRTVGDFKQEIFQTLNPGRLMDRPAAILIDGKARQADTQTLSDIGVTSNSTIYYF